MSGVWTAQGWTGISHMAGDWFYRGLAGALDATIWGGELVGRENLPSGGPAVFVSNHAGALGPIAVCASVPLRLWPWAHADMVDWETAPAYLCQDFVKPVLHAPDGLAMPLSRLIAQASVRLLHRIEAIPAWRDKRVVDTLNLSEDCLIAGHRLLIFAEDPALPMDPQSGMRPFMTGFARLGRIHYDRTGKLLQFYPVAVLMSERVVEVAPPISFNPLNAASYERLRIAHLLEAIIRRMVLREDASAYAGVPLPP